MLTVLDHPLAADLLTRLRDKRTGPAEFRSLTRRLGAILVVEATRQIPTVPSEVQTPLEPFTGSMLGIDLVAIPVLRAGLGLLDAVTDLYPDTVVGYLGMERDEETHEPRDYYAKLPSMKGRHALAPGPHARDRWLGLGGVHVTEERIAAQHHVRVRGGGARRGRSAWRPITPTCRSWPARSTAS